MTGARHCNPRPHSVATESGQPDGDQASCPTLSYGDTFGNYVINGFAGKGATSRVYEARPRDSFDRVAVKVLDPRLLEDPAKRRKFYREARIMTRMRHPNVVRFKEILEVDGRLAYAMEYIDGQTLEQWLEAEAPGADQMELSCLFIDILRGLTHAHGHGVVHRDMKPANIMITAHQGRYVAKVIDFGLARFANQPVSADEQSKIAGTAAYISPEEVLDPESVGRASDLYSLGVMLYQAACGQLPFAGMAARELLDAHAHHQPKRPRQINPTISPAFEDIIMRTLSKHPGRRFDSAPAMIAALEVAIQRELRPDDTTRQILDDVQTTDVDRIPNACPVGEPSTHNMMSYLLACMRAMVAVVASTGASGEGGADPHHLNRSPDPGAGFR